MRNIIRNFDNQFEPESPVLPGTFITSMLEAYEMSRTELSQRCDCTLEYLNEVIDKGLPIKPSLAIELERAIGIPATMLLECEHQYRFQLAKTKEFNEGKKYHEWLNSIPIDFIVETQNIEKPNSLADKYTKVLEFYGVGSIQTWKEEFQTSNTDYRHSKLRKSDFVCLATWIRLGQIAAKNITRSDKKRNLVKSGSNNLINLNFDRKKFKEAMKDIRVLTCIPITNALPKIEKICASVGVCFLLIPPVPKIYVSGAAWWLSPEKPVIQLNTQHETEDQFWFSFFHEAAHIMLHGKKKIYVDGKETNNKRQEKQANEWASNILIPKRAWKKFINFGEFTESNILVFANELNVAPGIIVDKLQNIHLIEPNQFNQLKVKLGQNTKLQLKSVKFSLD